jgi:hypothetical protein
MLIVRKGKFAGGDIEPSHGKEAFDMSRGFFLFLEHKKKKRECTSVGVLGNKPTPHTPSQPLKTYEPHKEDEDQAARTFLRVRAMMLSTRRASLAPTSH